MPNNSLLFSINSEGRVYSLSTNGSFWREFMYLGIEFKTLSAIPHFLWAVGGDRQIYVHVHGLEIPIRVREESYENERWLPLDGFSSRLLPTDRHHFSSQDGTKDRSIEKIRLPSMAWQWEGEWQLELTLDGQPLDHDGWSYAVDFPAHYGPSKTWKSCVRRRKWVRYRKYSAMNSWCAIAPLHKDPTEEPFIDVCIGGNQVPHATAGLLAVWAITAQCRIMFRTGVSTTSPEGLRWTNVAIPPGSEIKQISVGPTGLVWALLWTGRALVRKGVTRDCLIGETWLEVRSPDDVKLSVLSVGYDTVWALSTDNRVWFRKGINGNSAGHSEVAALGTGWLEIGGTMTNISVATNDQVFAVGELDKCLYWRNGITPTELTGKRWRAVQAPLHMSRTSSIASATSRSTSRSPKSKHRSLTTLNQSLIEENTDPGIFGSWEESHSAPTVRTLPIKPLAAIKKSLDVGSHSNSEPDQSEISGKSFETMLRNPRAWSPVRSVGSVLGMEAHPESDSSAFDCDSGLYCEDEIDQTAWNESNTQWTYVEAGGCIIDPVQMPHWFADSNNGPTIELSAAWRIELLESLKDRNLLAGLDFTNYGHAIEDKGWSRSGEARQIHPNGTSEECTLTLNWHATETMGTMSVCNPDGASIKFILNLNDITCVAPSSETASPRITIFTPRRFKIPIKLQFNTESEYEDWLNVFVDVTAQVNALKGKPSRETIWAVTSIGDILTWDSRGAKTCLEKEGLFTKEFNVYGKSTTHGYITELHNSFNVGSELEVKGCLEYTVDRFSINLQGPHRTKHKGEIETDVPFHFNPRLLDNVVVQNTKIDGEWGSEERSGDVPFHQGQEFLLRIVCCLSEFEVYVNGKLYTRYKHRLLPQIICSLKIIGALKLYTVKYGSKSNIVGPDEMVWRLMGGHLRQVETSGCGLVWGISNDHSPWVYTGGWGGGVYKGIGNSTDGINAMSDSQSYFVYENQRWNPLTGYCTSGLPTDRHMWSDVTGKYKRTRESTKLFNRHWHWISEWIVDYNTPGGVDSDGWQYATDFPAPYHGKKLFTDCVRRRRWFRRAQLITEGPWMRAGNTPLSDISLWASNSDECEGAIATWAITTAGDAVYRSGVTLQYPTGSSWIHVSSPQLLSSVSLYKGVLWTVGRKGEIYFRVGITADNPTGNSWRLMEAPREAGGRGARAAALCRGRAWVLLASGQVVLRRGISARYPAGTEWDYLPDSNITLKHISAGDDEVWGVGQDGALYRRNGICNEIDIGTMWQKVLNANFIHVSARGYNI